MESDPEAVEPMRLTSSQLGERELHARLREIEPEQRVELKLVGPLDAGLAAGVDRGYSLKVDGDGGDYVMLLAADLETEILGNVGTGCGHSMLSGNLLIHGRAGDYLGCYAQGGLISVYKSAGHHCGESAGGVDIVVAGRAGDYAARGMSAGVLVLGNGAGEQLGLDMRGGVLYVRGKVGSMSDGLKTARMKEADSLRLSLLLARSGLKGKVSEFRVLMPKSK